MVFVSKIRLPARHKQRSHETVAQKSDESRPSCDSSRTSAGDSSPVLCECRHRGIEILHDLAGTSSFSSLETKESGLLCLEHMLDLLEQISTCKMLSGHEHSQDFLSTLCRKTLTQCQQFNEFLSEMLEKKGQPDQQPLLQRDYPVATIEERRKLLCSLTYLQLKKLHDCVGRLIRTLQERPAFEEHPWSHLREQCYQLAIDSYALCSRASYL
ncbi:hypothetical protein EYZ11_003601 [Aspergillus tanneri]|uniref:Uncharacterized protein n=1 Tax=Aspergillus tanneri TaxID=1220188 RepID=A0A4S3JND2_9EURO|nr:uncharacterized protein ATNIH1004_007323 [Aspergillus tanneri]KAA8645902.1 hypothetical protein ATNIH1004_007323 [Aspergillus tanneri]THC96940.1 hypothetical protein EYZ11_003601 [Aspergillus tanneri]